MAKRAQPPNQHSTTWRRLSPYTARAVDQYEAILFPHALRFTGNSSSDYRALIRTRFGGSFKNTFACKFLYAAKSECESLILPHEKQATSGQTPETDSKKCCVNYDTQQDGYRISTGATVDMVNTSAAPCRLLSWQSSFLCRFKENWSTFVYCR